MGRQTIAATMILTCAALAGILAASLPARSRPAAVPATVAARPQPARATARPVVTSAAPAPRPSAAADPLTVKRVLDIGPIKFGDFTWDDRGVPAGPLIVTVDLAAETLSVFRDGYEIGATAILYGADDKPTPLGTFPITQKDAHHVSNLYDAPMPYMLRLTNDGVSIHGSKVEWGYATHGCIGVPLAFAQKLFGAARLGDRVIITRGKALATGEALTS
jgi:lipoprotein-anchoring transpeptidase ErfK/SrfK